MNQILITKKLYVTPELKRKKKAYKIEFFLSVFLFLTLTSAYIYAEYDRNKSEEVSQEILADIDEQEKDNTIADSDALVIVLDDVEQTEELNKEEPVEVKLEIQIAPGGFRYTTIATINIPKIGVTYPILDGETDSVEETEALLKISPTKFWGADPNEVGNFCITGHNYRNSRFFSKVPTLVNGDIIEIIAGKVTDKFERIKVKNTLIDGKSSDDVGELVMKDREMLSDNGIVLVSATLSKKDKVLLVGPEITTKGFIYVKEAKDMIHKMKEISEEVITRNITNGFVDYNKIKTELRSELSNYLYEQTECKPMIIAVVQEV